MAEQGTAKEKKEGVEEKELTVEEQANEAALDEMFVEPKQEEKEDTQSDATEQDTEESDEAADAGEEEEEAPAGSEKEDQADESQIEDKKVEKAQSDADALAEMRQMLNEMAKRTIGGEAAPVATASGSSVQGAVGSAVASDSPTNKQFESLIKILGPQAVAEFSKNMEKPKDYLTKEELDTVIDKPELIVKAINDVRRHTAEEVLNVIPTIVSSMVGAFYTAQRKSADFYEVNKDLAPYREFVSMTYRQVEATKSEKDTHDDLLVKTAQEVRKKLRLPAPTSGESSQKSSKKTFLKQKGKGIGTRSTPRVDGPKTQADYISDFVKEMGG